MTTEQFAFWAQGFFEISDAKTLDEKQVQIFKDHLALVFEKKTPDYQHSFGPTYGGIRLLDSKGELRNTSLHDLPYKIWNKEKGWVEYSGMLHATGIPPPFKKVLSEYLSGDNLSSYGTIGYIKGPQGGYLSPYDMKDFLKVHPEYMVGSGSYLSEPFGPNRLITC